MTPHAKQQQVLDSDARFVFVLGGRRSGMTTIGARWAIQQARKSTGGSRGLLLTPDFVTHPASRHALVDEISEATNGLFELPSLERVVSFGYGDTAHIAGASNPTVGRGEALDWAWLDCAQDIDAEVVLSVLPSIAQRKGRVLLTFNEAQEGWIPETYWRLVDEGKSVELIEMAAIENEAVSRESIAEIARIMRPEVFVREYFPRFATREEVEKQKHQREIQRLFRINNQVCPGVDWGLS